MSANPQVTFQTAFFEPMHGEDRETTPGRYGKQLAHWLAEKLKRRGVSVEGIIPKDFGWVVLVSTKPFMLWLSCGNTDGSTIEWNVFPVAQSSTIQRVLKRVNPAREIEKLRAHLAELVPSIPGVTNVTWD